MNDGKVYLIRNNFGPNPAAVPLHEEHAREYFEAAAKAAPPPRASAAQAPITAEEMDELRRRGFSGDDLFDMNPKRAREIIADPRYERMGERFRVGAKTAEPCHVCLERGAKMITCIASGETVALHLKCAPLYDEATGAPPVED